MRNMKHFRIKMKAFRNYMKPFRNYTDLIVNIPVITSPIRKVKVFAGGVLFCTGFTP